MSYAGAFARRAAAVQRRFMAGLPPRPDGKVLPPGNDPAAFHPKEDVVADATRWRLISFVFLVPVGGLIVKTVMADHSHHPPDPPEYEYLRISNKVPRFPWGDNDLIGTPSDRARLRGEH